MSGKAAGRSKSRPIVLPDFARYEIFADLNYSEPAGNPGNGGRYLVGYQFFDDRDLNRFGFKRLDIELRQYISLLRERRVLALRALASMSEADEEQEIPFYFQGTLGGPDDLRGFRRYRFRDRHLILLQAEYRWEVFTAMDAAVFYDAGKVAARREDLDLSGLELGLEPRDLVVGLHVLDDHRQPPVSRLQRFSSTNRSTRLAR